MLGSASHHMSGFASHSNGVLDMRSGGVPHGGDRAPAAYPPPAQSVTSSDDHYWHYIHSEVSEFPRADGAAPNFGFVGNAPLDFSYAASHQHREPQYAAPQGFGAYPAHSRSTQFLPPVQSFGHAVYDTTR